MTARPGLSPGHAVAAALPAMLVHVLAAADAAGSEPSGELRAAYRARGQEIALTDPSGEIRTLAVAVADPLTTERTGTGWALLATAIGLDEHADKLPVPGRPRRRPKAKEAGAAEAGFAYQFGRRLTAGTALALLET